MPRGKNKDLSAEAMLASIMARTRSMGETEFDKWRRAPVKLFAQYGLVFPPKILNYFRDCINPKIPTVGAVANRGGGKTEVTAAAASYLFAFHGFDVYDVAGSEKQARELYDYAREFLGEENLQLGDELEAKKTEADLPDRYFRVAAASTKQIRGPHLGKPRAATNWRPKGGLLIQDEVAEMPTRILDGSISMINTARPGLRRAVSTNHESGSKWADIVRDPKKHGFDRWHEWNCFDVAEQCRYSCRKCPVEFAGKKHPDYHAWLRHHGHDADSPDAPRGWCEGRAKKNRPSGWMQIKTLRKFLDQLGPEKFAIEYMNAAPSGAGHIIPQRLLDDALTGENRLIKPMPDMPCAMGIDWGFRFTAFCVLQQQANHKAALLDAEHLVRTHDLAIKNTARKLARRNGCNYGRADASNIFLCQEVERSAELRIIPYQFTRASKEYGISALKRLFEEGRILIPGEKLASGKYNFPTPFIRALFEQLANWKRDEEGRVVKGDDHYPDALLQIAPDFCAGDYDYSSQFVPKSDPPPGGTYEKLPAGAFNW